MGIKQIAKSIWNKIPNTVRIPIFVLIFALPIWLLLAFLIRRFLSNFGEGLLVETFGMLLDVIVIGIIILWLNEIRDKKLKRELEIERYLEEIDDYRGWDEKEATFRIVGNINRLNRKGVTNINLNGCYLKNASLSGANLQNAEFSLANLQGAYLMKANLQKAFLLGARLQGAFLYEANLQDAFLGDANLQGVDLLRTNLQGANFEMANLFGAKNVDVKMLSKVKTLYKAKLDPDLEREIKEKYLHLLEKPEEGKE